MCKEMTRREKELRDDGRINERTEKIRSKMKRAETER